MPDNPQNELRQIKWILAGILACLVVIAFALAPGLLALLGPVYLAVVLWTLSSMVRAAVKQLWLEVVAAVRGGR